MGEKVDNKIWSGATLLLAFLPATVIAEWSHYGADAGGNRYVDLNQITPENVSELKLAWQFQTGDMAEKGPALRYPDAGSAPDSHTHSGNESRRGVMMFLMVNGE